MNIMPAQEPYRTPLPPLEPPPFHWLAHLLSFLRRRWPLMAISVAVAVALGLAYALSSTPRFTAETNLLIDIRRAEMLRQQAGVQDSQTLNAVLESQVELLRSEGLARKVVTRLGLLDDPLFSPPRGLAAVKSHSFVRATAERLGLVGDGRLAVEAHRLIDGLRSLTHTLLPAPAQVPAAPERIAQAALQLTQMTSVRRIGLTYVLSISVTSPSAVEAARLANGVAEAFIADQLEAKEETILQATGWLQARINELRDQALAADRGVQDYKAKHQIIDTDRGLMGGQQLTELSSQLVGARAHTAEMLARLQRIETIMQGGVTGGGVADGLDNKVIVGLRQQYVDDDRRAADLAAKYGPDHIAVRNLRNEMIELRKSIQTETGRIAETYKSDYEVARASETAVQQRLDQRVAAEAQTNSDLVTLRSLESAAETYRSLYENFLQRYTQAVQDQSFPVPEARVITTAMPPLRKSEPKTTIILALAAVLGGGLGFAIAFVREALDRGIRTPAQLRAVTGLDCLGLLPRIRQRNAKLRRRRPARSGSAQRYLPTVAGDMLRDVVEHPGSPFADAVHGIWMRILRQRMRSQDIKVIGFTTNRAGAGASTVAANVAQFLAQTGARTILLDWDFLQAALTRSLTGAADPGCLDVLRTRAKIADVAWCDPQTDLRFLPAGNRILSAADAAMAASERMHDLLSELRGTHSYVVVDLPSLSATAASHVAAHMLDAIVLIAEWGRVDQDGLAEHLARIGLDETMILGVVLNKVNVKGLKTYLAPAAEYAMVATPY